MDSHKMKHAQNIRFMEEVTEKTDKRLSHGHKENFWYSTPENWHVNTEWHSRELQNDQKEAMCSLIRTKRIRMQRLTDKTFDGQHEHSEYHLDIELNAFHLINSSKLLVFQTIA